MAITVIDGALFKTLIINGASNLKVNYQYVDSLNVFPVPDGDTGTNMKMTIEGGINEISTIDEKNIFELTKKLYVPNDTYTFEETLAGFGYKEKDDRQITIEEYMRGRK